MSYVDYTIYPGKANLVALLACEEGLSKVQADLAAMEGYEHPFCRAAFEPIGGDK